ncbi:type II secretion system protein [Janthinobacterium sp. SUN137]|uniref:type II secretion system protein n=1 Tax=Janthinobacterium sp. SUN137 TaxID=3014789 RepID=UPI002713AEDF|nr:type II secretion system protein [Janthinobacterium sp. SUN137]MDO8042163.1 type II secretion system protein [Janthinobacterium sp. SUN137]
MHRPARRQRGVTYLGLIILVAILGLVGAAGLKMGSLLQRQAAEQELLDIGAEFIDALQSYTGATPAGQPQHPPTLAALLRDPRFPQVRRHLRKLYVDPVTGRAEWGLLYQPGGQGIIGVHSLSSSAPLKVGNFDARFTGFEGKSHLSEWQFVAGGPVPPAGLVLAPADAGALPSAAPPALFPPPHPAAPASEPSAPEAAEPEEEAGAQARNPP